LIEPIVVNIKIASMKVGECGRKDKRYEELRAILKKF